VLQQQQIMDPTRLWDAMLMMMRTQLSGPSYDTWLAPLQVAQLTETTLHLQAHSQFQKEWVLKHYQPQLLASLEAVFTAECPELPLPTLLEVTVRPLGDDPINPSDEADVLLHEPADRPWTPRAAHSQLNPRYVFEQFVVGAHSRLCHAVAVAIAEAPATQYNPYFIHGPAGLGKTHLMHAVGHEIHHRYPGLLVKYVTTEQFTNELIQALATKRMNQFREKYRRMDVLLLDDVQFLEGKERTQEEMFHTFNTLHQAGKQIVITSDRPPAQLQGLEERLRSRFGWGLTGDMSAPDLETRVAILQKKAERDGLTRQVTLNNEMLTVIAECFPHNIRELEGALNKVVAMALLEGPHWDMASLQKLLGRETGLKRLSPEAILTAVSGYFHVKVPDLKGPGRSKDISYARQAAVYLIRSLLDISFPKIGELMGGRNHASIMYGFEKVRDDRAHNAQLDQQLNEIKRRLASSNPN
jgi:chromosomal replication initiator protein